MSVYIDAMVDHDKRIGRAGPEWCHMIADTLDELHAMAERIDLRRGWFPGTLVDAALRHRERADSPACRRCRRDPVRPEHVRRTHAEDSRHRRQREGPVSNDKPFSDEELAGVRARAERETYRTEDVPRLLATLDLARTEAKAATRERDEILALLDEATNLLDDLSSVDVDDGDTLAFEQASKRARDWFDAHPAIVDETLFIARTTTPVIKERR